MHTARVGTLRAIRLQQLVKHRSPWTRPPGDGVSRANTYETIRIAIDETSPPAQRGARTADYLAALTRHKGNLHSAAMELGATMGCVCPAARPCRRDE
ncbi:hypothetical protein [Streptomyces sp. NPDC020681]|uniref:hypothetical protein n=1 Tax=Streptomyces sp. NPDC020681 TaxID=3365083 RepID=UPI0037B8365C